MRTMLAATAAAIAVATSALLFGPSGTAMADIPVGPGPTQYTEQPQPAPGTCHYRTAANGQTLPDPNCTPGALNPKVTDATLALATTICRPGYTKSIRPSVDITEAEKRANAASYGYTGPLSDAEYHHLVPLESSWGEIPTIRATFGSDPGASPNRKDGVEHKLHQLVRKGAMPLASARQAIATDWTTAR